MNPSRRHFLKTCSLCSLLSITPGLLTSCFSGPSGALRGPVGPVANARLSAAAAGILNHAALAPSGHNSQPWQVSLHSPRHWSIGIPPRRRLPAVDPHARESLISLGAFVENLVQAALAYGYQVAASVTASDPQETKILEIKLSPQSPATTVDLSLLGQRRTVKQGQQQRLLQSSDVRLLQLSSQHRLDYLPRDQATAASIRAGTVLAMASQCQRDAAMAELARWIRFRRSAVNRQRDGLTVAGMELNGLAGWWVGNFYQADDVMTETFRRKTVTITEELSRQGAGWLVLHSAGDSPTELIAVGRSLQRILLQARRLNIACHPMSQLLEEQIGQRELALQFGADHSIQMLLRVGYLERYPAPVTPRRPAQWFVTG
ncbi:Acg family FMN-binding oxidoreductase [Pelobacter seleniigenes]|uniref:Acg family FMN-binding oxidoreductase n=1 Tax=Pelobacter seleniigenes TaxID=407188 RepID=UPI0006898BA0|nr:hypothetical protein [Pelobacter seleniigenes]